VSHCWTYFKNNHFRNILKKKNTYSPNINVSLALFYHDFFMYHVWHEHQYLSKNWRLMKLPIFSSLIRYVKFKRVMNIHWYIVKWQIEPAHWQRSVTYRTNLVSKMLSLTCSSRIWVPVHVFLASGSIALFSLFTRPEIKPAVHLRKLCTESIF
jgi:hypothetical protein